MASSQREYAHGVAICRLSVVQIIWATYLRNYNGTPLTTTKIDALTCDDSVNAPSEQRAHRQKRFQQHCAVGSDSMASSNQGQRPETTGDLVVVATTRLRHAIMVGMSLVPSLVEWMIWHLFIKPAVEKRSLEFDPVYGSLAKCFGSDVKWWRLAITIGTDKRSAAFVPMFGPLATCQPDSGRRRGRGLAFSTLSIAGVPRIWCRHLQVISPPGIDKKAPHHQCRKGTQSVPPPEYFCDGVSLSNRKGYYKDVSPFLLKQLYRGFRGGE